MSESTIPNDGPTLAVDEAALATLLPDLDDAQHFASATVTLTTQRLHARDASGHVVEWPLTNRRLSMRMPVDHAGLGALELCEGDRRVARWCFTLDQHDSAVRMMRLFTQQAAKLRGEAMDPEDEAATDDWSVAASVAPPSTWVLLRLRRFAAPYRWQLALGFVLTMLSTAAAMVPPYLTIPLMDDVLIPFQNGQQIAPSKVAWLLAGLAGVIFHRVKMRKPERGY